MVITLLKSIRVVVFNLGQAIISVLAKEIYVVNLYSQSNTKLLPLKYYFPFSASLAQSILDIVQGEFFVKYYMAIFLKRFQIYL